MALLMGFGLWSPKGEAMLRNGLLIEVGVIFDELSVEEVVAPLT